MCTDDITEVRADVEFCGADNSGEIWTEMDFWCRRLRVIPESSLPVPILDFRKYKKGISPGIAYECME